MLLTNGIASLRDSNHLISGTFNCGIEPNDHVTNMHLNLFSARQALMAPMRPRQVLLKSGDEGAMLSPIIECGDEGNLLSLTIETSEKMTLPPRVGNHWTVVMKATCSRQQLNSTGKLR